MFKFKNILQQVCDLFSLGVNSLCFPQFLAFGIPHKFNQSRFSGVARVKRMARKMRNRRNQRRNRA